MQKLWEVILVKRRFGPNTEHTSVVVKAKYLCSRHILMCLGASRTQNILFQHLTFFFFKSVRNPEVQVRRHISNTVKIASLSVLNIKGCTFKLTDTHKIDLNHTTVGWTLTLADEK